MVNLILSFANGTSVNAQDLESGYSPLQKALGAGELFIVMALLANSNINLDSKDNEGLDWIDYFFETISLPYVLCEPAQPTSKATWLCSLSALYLLSRSSQILS